MSPTTSSSLSPLSFSSYQFPNSHFNPNPKSPILHHRRHVSLSFTITTNHNQHHHKTPRHTATNAHHTFLEDLYSFTQSNDEDICETSSNREFENDNVMRWVDWKAALGQRFNLEGIISSFKVVTRDRKLVIPHMAVKDIRYVDWFELRRKGFKGVVFDKDNTITAPYSLSLWPPLEESMECCKNVFGNDIAVFSNSAGLTEYDPEGLKARALEKAIGIRVLRHKMKKPAGTSEEVEKHFGCNSSELIMVGDRPFTDIVYGNRNGFLTILTEPLSPSHEPFIVKQVRKLELFLVSWWSSKGLKPSSHPLLPDPSQCVKNPSSL